MDSNHKQEKNHDKTSLKIGIGKSKNVKKIFLIVGVVLFIFFLLTLKATTYIENPDLCKRCHSMKFYYNTWTESSHSKIGCYDCHFGFTPVAKQESIPVTTRQYWNIEIGKETINVSDTMNRIKDTIIKINTQINNFNARVSEINSKASDLGKVYEIALGDSTSDENPDFWANCLKCHKDLLSQNSKVDNYGHSQHFNKGLACNQCHRVVVHGRPLKPTRQECVQCHNKPLTWPSSHQESSFPVTHGQSYTGSCTLCHEKGVKSDLCQNCHGIDMPHTEGYTMYHIKEINQVGIDTCLKCHQDPPQKNGSTGIANPYVVRNPNFKPKVKTDSKPEIKPLAKAMSCNECHGPGLPHRGYQKILRTHGTLAMEKGTKGCLSCHQSKKCTDCHGMTIPHPNGFIQQHPSVAKSSNTDKCLQCHKDYNKDAKAKSCNSCHTVQMPHPENWNNDHGNFKDANCSYCHSSKNPVNPKASYARDNFCQKCHDVKPHRDIHSQPEKWPWTEKQCYSCHDGGKGCATCHQRNGGVE